MQIVGYTIREVKREEWRDMMTLAWDTFLRYDSECYSDKGKNSFNKFINDNRLMNMWEEGNYLAYIAEHNGDMVGMITCKGMSHISLLFVGGDYQRKGVGMSLLSYVISRNTIMGIDTDITVNAAPSSRLFYEKMGFISEGEEVECSGLTQLPMIYRYRSVEIEA